MKKRVLIDNSPEFLSRLVQAQLRIGWNYWLVMQDMSSGGKDSSEAAAGTILCTEDRCVAETSGKFVASTH